MASQQSQEGTGKHPHKSSEEPYPHTKGQSGQGQQEHEGGQQQQGGSSEGGGESDDLKSREYRDAQGNVHHHTRTYQEQHKGENK
jgi:hypothetical protein